MRRLLLLSGAGLALILSGCDQVRLPGADNPLQLPGEKAAPRAAVPEKGSVTEADLQPAAPETAPEPAAAPFEIDTAPAETAAGPADDAPPADGSNEAADDTGEEDSDADAGETSEDEATDDDTAAVQPAALMAATLGQINAMRCALPEEAPPTPTVAMVAGATPPSDDPVVGVEAVGGLAASLGSFPGIVKLEPRRAEPTGATATGHCGALRISTNWFVTAAHCIDQPFDELRLIGEAEDLRSPAARRVSASLAVCHAGYQGTANGYANDIALMRLSDEQVENLANVPIARFGPTLRPLAPANYPEADMAGWGITSYGGPLSNQLLTTGLKLVSAGPAAITVRSRNGAGPCIGDSGGPLYVTEPDGTRTAIGILSVVEQNRTTGNFCEGDYAGRYTNLQGYAGWMSEVMSLCEMDPSACR